MGPTPFSVGYAETMFDECGCAGALQWGQHFSALDTIVASQQGDCNAHAAMGPTPFSVGYTSARGGTSPQTTTSCNGANAFQRWILPRTEEDYNRIKALQWGQRLSALDIGRQPRNQNPRTGASMGPTPFSVGYRNKVWTPERRAYVLQWGQRLSALDTQKLHGGVRGRMRAAMGPTHFSVGYKMTSLNSTT